MLNGCLNKVSRRKIWTPTQKTVRETSRKYVDSSSEHKQYRGAMQCLWLASTPASTLGICILSLGLGSRPLVLSGDGSLSLAMMRGLALILLLGTHTLASPAASSAYKDAEGVWTHVSRYVDNIYRYL